MFGDNISPWEIVSAVATAVGTLFVMATIVVTAFFARRQLREALATRHLQSVLGLFEQLESGSVRAARWLLYHHRERIHEILSKEDGLSELETYLGTMPGGKDAPTSVLQLRDELVTMEYAAAFSLLGLIPRELERTYVIPILHFTWLNAEPFARATRRELDTPVYLQHCEAVYRLAESGEAYSEKYEVTRRAKRDALRRLIQQSRPTADKAPV